MENIYKTINIDNSRSHRNGLLPFVHYSSGKTICEVNANTINGNYGNYVCDFCIFNGNNEDKKEISRLKYLDVIREYRRVHQILKEGTFIKKINVLAIEEPLFDCYFNDKTVKFSENPIVKFTEDFDEINSAVLCDYIPLDISLFKIDGGYYTFVEPFEYVVAKEKEEKGENLNENEKNIIEKVVNHRNLISNNEKYLFVLLDDYDYIIEVDKWWSNWWVTNSGNEKWENVVFDNYEPHNKHLKFYTDINRYVLGEIEVPSKYNGDLVPSYIYYLNYFNLKNWFEINSATTINAYNGLIDDESIIKKWEEKGGGEFYEFLSKIIPKWQTYKQYAEFGNNVYFGYRAPYITVDTIINSDYEYEMFYRPYEYNIVDDVLEGAVKQYEPFDIKDLIYIKNGYNENGELKYYNKYFIKDTLSKKDDNFYIITNNSISANGLTKQWLNCMTFSAYCESQLPSLMPAQAKMISDNLYGIYQSFTDDFEDGMMFSCTFCTGASLTPYFESFYSAKTITNTVGLYDDNETYIRKTFLGKNEEVVPSTNAYQIVGVNIVSSKTITETKTNTIVNGDETKLEYYWSSVTTNYYSWWECEPILSYKDENFICADGEAVKPITENDIEKKYYNVTIVSCIENLIDKCKNGNTFYVLARYNNGNTNMAGKKITETGDIISIKYPYVSGYPVNIDSYDNGTIVYDKVLEINENLESKTIIFKYAKGITSAATIDEIEKNETCTGIHYMEILPFEKNIKSYINIDGVNTAEVYYDKIYTENNSKNVYNTDYNISRSANIARIIGMEIGTQWNKDASVNAMLLTVDGDGCLKDMPKYNINVLYDRGNASAWESHFKLSECNTLEDLENYGNNFFNI